MQRQSRWLWILTLAAGWPALVTAAATTPTAKPKTPAPAQPATAKPMDTAVKAAAGPATKPLGTAIKAADPAKGQEEAFERHIKDLIEWRRNLNKAERQHKTIMLRIERLRKQREEAERMRKRRAKPKDAATPGPQGAPKPLPIDLDFDLKDTKSLLLLALSLYRLGDYEKALHYYQQVAGRKPSQRDHVWAQFQIGNCQFALGQYDECVATMSAIANAYPDSIWSRHAAFVIKDVSFWKKRQTISETSK